MAPPSAKPAQTQSRGRLIVLLLILAAAVVLLVYTYARRSFV